MTSLSVNTEIVTSLRGKKIIEGQKATAGDNGQWQRKKIKGKHQGAKQKIES